MSEVSGRREETCCIRGQGWQPRGATLRPKSVAAGRSYPTWRSGAEAERSHHSLEARDGSREEPPQAGGQGRRPGGPT